MAEYKIERVSNQEPRKWHNEKFNSDTFYIKVKLEGRERPVEIGKKNPDALKVGDTVYGTIQDKPDYEADGFKADSPAFGNGGGFNKGGGYKDNSDGQRQGMCFNNAANFVTELHKTTKDLSPDNWAKAVYEYANALYKLGDLGSSEGTNPKVAATPTTSKPWKVNSNTDNLWPSDLKDNDPEFESMLAAGLSADDINLDDIPF